jgi:hypothetical protein
LARHSDSDREEINSEIDVLIGTIDVRPSEVLIFSITPRITSSSIAVMVVRSESMILLWSGGMINGIRPVALTAERIFERVCLRLLLEAKSSLVMTMHNGLSNFKQSSRWAFAKSMPAPALPSIS